MVPVYPPLTPQYVYTSGELEEIFKEGSGVSTSIGSRPDSADSFRGTPTSSRDTPVPPETLSRQTETTEPPLGIAKHNSEPVRKIAKEKMPPRRHSHNELSMLRKQPVIPPVKHEHTTFGIMKLVKGALQEQTELDIPPETSLRKLTVTKKIVAGYLTKQDFEKDRQDESSDEDNVYKKPLTTIESVPIPPRAAIPFEAENIPPYITIILEGRSGACFNPEHISRMVFQYAGRNFSFSDIPDYYRGQPCDAHVFSKLNGNNPLRKNIYKDLIDIDIREEFLNYKEMRSYLERNLHNLFFLDQQTRKAFGELINRFIFEINLPYILIDFLDDLVDRRKSTQALALISFICSLCSKSRALCILRCEYLVKKGFYEEAHASLDMITMIDPLIKWADLLFAECLLFQGKLLRASGIFPLDKSLFYNSYYAKTILGSILTFQLDKVSPVIDQVLAENPSYPLALVLRANYYFSKHDVYRALIDYSKLAEFYPDFHYAKERYEFCKVLWYGSSSGI